MKTKRRFMNSILSKESISRTKRILSYILPLTLAALLLAACSPDERRPEPPEQASSAAAADSPVRTDPPGQASGVPGHLTRELAENVFVDAELSVPDTDECAEYRLVPKVYTPAFLSGLFLADDGSAQTISSEESGSDSFLLTTENGSSLTSSAYGLYFSSPTSSVDLDILDVMKQYASGKQAADDKELSFMSRGEALDSALAAAWQA
ncbi:MAG: hypothetical protein LBQ15_09570 [Clostridium sp.]|nr:hypothetical protein [Clostridium sp.]